jgi:hypothetical protein
MHSPTIRLYLIYKSTNTNFGHTWPVVIDLDYNDVCPWD